MNTVINPDPANGTTVPNAGIAAARPKPRSKRATLAAAVVSAGLTLFGLGLAAGTAHADPGPLPTGWSCNEHGEHCYHTPSYEETHPWQQRPGNWRTRGTHVSPLPPHRHH